MDGGQFEPARELRQLGPVHWYRRPGKSAALVISVDDVFPGTPHNPYEAGGALEKGALVACYGCWSDIRSSSSLSLSPRTGDRYPPSHIVCGARCPGYVTGFILRACCRKGQWTFATIQSSLTFSMPCRAPKSRYMACIIFVEVVRSSWSLKTRTVQRAPACWPKRCEFSMNAVCTTSRGFNLRDGTAALRYNMRARMSESSG